MSTLNDFIANIKSGLANTSHFSVVVKPPVAIANDNNIKANMEKVLLFCEQVSLPGVSYVSNPIRAFGETYEIPYEKTYEPITLSFYVDADMNVKRLFDKWINLIQDTTTRTFSYPDTYISDTLDILIYDKSDKNTYVCKLHRCFPKTVSAIQMDYNSHDVMKLNVTFSYKYYTTEQISTAFEISKTNAFDTGSTIMSDIESGIQNYGLNVLTETIPSNYFNDFSKFQSLANSVENYGDFFNGSTGVSFI